MVKWPKRPFCRIWRLKSLGGASDAVPVKYNRNLDVKFELNGQSIIGSTRLGGGGIDNFRAKFYCVSVCSYDKYPDTLPQAKLIEISI